MNLKGLSAIAAFLVTVGSWTYAEETTQRSPAYVMSPALLELFRAEMRSLLAGAQAIAAAVPIADWEVIGATSEQMRKSYVLEQELSDAQRLELESLPDQFKNLDEQFHRGTEKLAHAASQRDSQLVAYYYARLLEQCTQCHEAYAQTRFPGFAREAANPQHLH